MADPVNNNRIKITADKRGLGRQAPSEDGNSLLIGHSYVVVDGVQQGEIYPLSRIEDAEDLGITDANDRAQGMLLWYHIDEYFRLAPGTKLWLATISPSISFDEIFDENTSLSQTLRTLGGKVRNVGAFTNIIGGASTDELEDTLWAAIPKAAALWADEQNRNRPLACIILEGRNFGGSANDAGDLRAQESTGVSVVIAQDKDWADSDANFTNHAAVGTVLGLKAGRSVETNIGEVEGNNIQDKALGRWLNPGLSNNAKLSDFNDDPDTGDFAILGAKGYILPEVHGNKVVMNDDHTCDLIESDFYCMANTAVYAKAHREIYKNVLNEKNKKVKIDPATGNIDAVDCARFENQGNKVIGIPEGDMYRASEISGGKTFCDPEQDVLGTSKVELKFEVVPYGYSRGISGTIKFTKKLSN
jgi:hypothetical protein